MAKANSLKVKDIRAHLFIGVTGNHVELVYHDDIENGAGLGTALASLLEEDDKLFNIFSAAFLTACETRNNNPNWEKVKFPKKKDNPKQMNGAKSDEPFVKTRKTTKK
jgi:hypothetical protein